MKIPLLPVFSCVVIALVGLGTTQAQVGNGNSASSSTTPTTTNTEADYQSESTATLSERTAAKTALDAYLAAKNENNETRRLTLGKAMISKKITVRLTTVTRLQARVKTGACSRVEAQYQTAIQAQLTAVDTNLKTQQTQATALTASSGIKDLMQKVVEENRVFIIVAPGVKGQCAAYGLLKNLTKNIDPLVAKLTTAGADTTKLQSYLDTAQTSATQAATLYKQAVDNRAQTPTATLTQANAQLQVAIDNLQLAATEAQTLIDSLKQTTTAE